MKGNHVRERREEEDLLGFIEDGNYDIPELQALGYCVGSCIPPCRCICHGFHDKKDFPINWTCTTVNSIQSTSKGPFLGRKTSRPSKPTCRPKPSTRNTTLGSTITQGTSSIESPSTTATVVSLPATHHFLDEDYDDSLIEVTSPATFVDSSTSSNKDDSVTLTGTNLTTSVTSYTSLIDVDLTSSIGSDSSSTSFPLAADGSNTSSSLEESTTVFTPVNTHYPCAIHCKSPCECTCYEDCECSCYFIALPSPTTIFDIQPPEFTVTSNFPHLTETSTVTDLPTVPKPSTLHPPTTIQSLNPTKPPYSLPWLSLLCCCQKMAKVKRIFDRIAKVISDVVQPAVAFRMHETDVSYIVKTTVLRSPFKREVKRILKNVRNIEIDQLCISNQKSFENALETLVNTVKQEPLKFRMNKGNEELQKALCV